MCMRCCGRDHFGKCTGDAKCFVCAGKHEGAKHQCTAEGCGKRAEPCEHHAIRCANCAGPHMATSRRCPEKRPVFQKKAQTPTEMRSSPPRMGTEPDSDDLPTERAQAGMDAAPSDPERSTPTHVIPISSDISFDQIMPRDQSLPRLVKEVRSLTESFTGATQLHSSSDPTHMSIDDDSTST